jgi:DNA-binding MarR family transcriptional regulator
MERHTEKLLDLLQEVNRGIHEQIRDILQQQGLPFPSVVITRVLKEHPGITLSELARLTGLTKSHVSKTVEELVRLGYVEKRSDPKDQRLIRLTLTEAAHEHFRTIREAIRGRLTAVIAAVPEETVGALMTGLHILKMALDRVKAEQR